MNKVKIFLYLFTYDILITNVYLDPVIIMALSYLIAKKKFYSEQIAGCDIFQRELINLLSFHFNYQFSTDLPINFIQHIHKPGKLINHLYFNEKQMLNYVFSRFFRICGHVYKML